MAHIGRKRRPVLILTRNEVLEVRLLVTVAEVTTTVRGLASEVPLDHDEVGLDHTSVVNCDGVHTVAQSTLANRVGEVDEHTLQRICRAIAYAIGC
jgi:mRNA interferase MazF